MMSDREQMFVETEEFQEKAPLFSAFIRECTRHLHDEAHAHPFHEAITSGEIPRDGFIEMLAQFFLLHHVLENHLRALRARRADVRKIIEDIQFQEVNLRHDLVYFRRTPCSVRPLPATMRCTNLIDTLARERPLALLGFHYVMEGSKNGMSTRAAKFRECFALPEEKGTHFLNPYRERQKECWDKFKGNFDAVEWTEEERSDILDGIRLGYEAYCNIITDVNHHWSDEDDED